MGDRGEVEPLSLHLADQRQPRQMLGAVVADPALYLRWPDQPARLVAAHVAHGQPGRLCELVDRQLLGGRRRHHISPSVIYVTQNNVTLIYDASCSDVSTRSWFPRSPARR